MQIGCPPFTPHKLKLKVFVLLIDQFCIGFPVGFAQENLLPDQLILFSGFFLEPMRQKTRDVNI